MFKSKALLLFSSVAFVAPAVAEEADRPTSGITVYLCLVDTLNTPTENLSLDIVRYRSSTNPDLGLFSTIIRSVQFNDPAAPAYTLAKTVSYAPRAKVQLEENAEGLKVTHPDYVVQLDLNNPSSSGGFNGKPVYQAQVTGILTGGEPYTLTKRSATCFSF